MTQDDFLCSLSEAFLFLRTKEEVERFLKDLCTPQEIAAFQERWRVCQMLDEGIFSYRDIHEISKSSLTTISRVARFLKTEPHQGYRIILDRIKDSRMRKKNEND